MKCPLRSYDVRSPARLPLRDASLLLNTAHLTTSPIRVKGDFNLGAPNTAKLWGDFENHLLHSLNISQINTPVQQRTSKLQDFLEQQNPSTKSIAARDSHSSLEKLYTRRKSNTDSKFTQHKSSVPSEESRRLSTTSLYAGTLDFRRSSIQASQMESELHHHQNSNPLLKFHPRIEQAPIPSVPSQGDSLGHCSSEMRVNAIYQADSLDPRANSLSNARMTYSRPSLYQDTLLEEPLNKTMGDIYSGFPEQHPSKPSLRISVCSLEPHSRKIRNYRSTTEDLIQVQHKALALMAEAKHEEALTLLQDYEKHASYLCSPDQTIIKTVHLYLMALSRFKLGIPGILQQCDQALGLSERVDKRFDNYGALTIALQLHLCFLRAKVFVKNGPADQEQLAKGIAALRHIIQEQMPHLRKARGRNLKGTAKNSALVKHLETFKDFNVAEAKGLYAEALLQAGRYENAAKIYEGLIKEGEEVLQDEDSVQGLLNYYNQLGNCYSRLQKYEQSLKCYLKSRNIIRSYGLNVSAPIKAKILANIATLYMNLDCGREREAISLLEQSLELKKRALCVNNGSLIHGYMMLGKACLKLPLYGKACKTYKEALQLAIFEGQPELTISIILDYGKALQASGRVKEAMSMIESALEDARHTTPVDTLFRAWRILLDIYLEMKSLSKAKNLMRMIYAHLEAKKEELGCVGGVSRLPDMYTKLALAFKENDQTQEALLVFLKAYSQFKGFRPIRRTQECERYLALLQEIAGCYDELSLFIEAEKFLNEALKILKQFAPNNNALLDSRCGGVFLKLGQLSLKKQKNVFNRDSALYYFKQAEKCLTCSPWSDENKEALATLKREIANLKLAKSLQLSVS